MLFKSFGLLIVPTLERGNDQVGSDAGIHGGQASR
jgi:hypothetical protein